MSITNIIKNYFNSDTGSISIPIATVSIGFSDIESSLKITSLILGVCVSAVILANQIIKYRMLRQQEKSGQFTDIEP